LALAGAFLLFTRFQAPISLLELDLTWVPVVSAGKSGSVAQEEWRRPETLPRKAPPPPPPPKEEPKAAAPSSPAPPEGPAVGDGPNRNLAQVDRLPSFLSQVKPPYPVEAKAAQVEGTVILQVDIDATGAVKKVVLLKGLGHGCDEAAIDAAWRTTFIPALQGGSPVPVTYPLTYRFRFDTEADP
jgi:protein TonB